MRASSSAVRGPVVSQPERRVSATASISSSVIAGGWNERKSVRLVEESSGIRGDEAYAVRGGVRAREGLIARVADREHRTGAVGAAAQRREDVAGLAVDADPRTPARSSGTSTDSSTPAGATRNRVTAPPTSSPSQAGTRAVAERGVDREPVQVDARHRLDELGVVAAAEARRDLDHLRPVGADAQLRVRRPVLDPERRDRTSPRPRPPRCLAPHWARRARARRRTPAARRSIRSVTASAVKTPSTEKPTTVTSGPSTSSSTSASPFRAAAARGLDRRRQLGRVGRRASAPSGPAGRAP